MSADQPLALRLADEMEGNAKYIYDGHDPEQLCASAAEMRRLHAEVEVERASRQAAQVENEALKASLARAGLEQQRAVLEDRERCARICDELQGVPATEPRHCAEDIRA